MPGIKKEAPGLGTTVSTTNIWSPIHQIIIQGQPERAYLGKVVISSKEAYLFNPASQNSAGKLKCRVGNRKAFGGSLEDELQGKSGKDSEKKNIGHRKQNSGANIRKVSVPEGIEGRNLLAFFSSRPTFRGAADKLQKIELKLIQPMGSASVTPK